MKEAVASYLLWSVKCFFSFSFFFFFPGCDSLHLAALTNACFLGGGGLVAIGALRAGVVVGYGLLMLSGIDFIGYRFIGYRLYRLSIFGCRVSIYRLSYKWIHRMSVVDVHRLSTYRLIGSRVVLINLSVFDILVFDFLSSIE